MKNLTKNQLLAIKSKSKDQSIAIVGMSCRFPQAENLNEFWKVLNDGIDTVKVIPEKRWQVNEYYDPDPSVPGKSIQKHAAFLDNVDDIDPFFFNISPREAYEMSPSQKLTLELAWESIEDSCIAHKKLLGSNTGVYMGNIWHDFEHIRKAKNVVDTQHSALGQSANVIANRISYSFGFTGPSMVIDTGCSSSLVALHLALQGLIDRNIDYGMVGGVNHLLDPDVYLTLSKFGGLSPTGKCQTFDAKADGFVRGEGGAIVLLKRLSDAERDGDKIYAVIQGSAINNNGYNDSLPATNVEAQKSVIIKAYERTNILPTDVHFMEAHGTGTNVGDPIETSAIGEIMGKNRQTPLIIGSVKTNIGHLEGAAGMAGLLKVVLAINNKMIPQNLNFETPNPKIPFERFNLKVPIENTKWPTLNGETLKAGVNSFGWGGTNAHVAIEEYVESDNKTKDFPEIKRDFLVLPISARSEYSFKKYVADYISLIEGASNIEQVKRICAGAALKKSEFEFRKVFFGKNKTDLIENMSTFLESRDEVSDSQLNEEKKIVFVFPGQGSQWIGMGLELYEKEQVFKEVISDCDKAFRAYTNWSLIEELQKPEDKSRFDEIDVIQPTIFAIQVALAKLWISWGIKPTAVVGHSMGEVASAFIADALSLDDAAKIICTRSKLMKRCSGKGAMAVTELTMSDAEQFIKKYNGISIGVNNSPKSTVLSGNPDDIDKALSELEKDGIYCKKVNVDVASHSLQMDEIKPELLVLLEEICPKKEKIDIYSTVRCKKISGTELNANYWGDNLRNPVKFSDVTKQLIDEEFTSFVEISPNKVLNFSISESLVHWGESAVVAGSLDKKKTEYEALFENLSLLYAGGNSVSWERLYGVKHMPYTELPIYKWQRENYSLRSNSEYVATKRNATSPFPVLGEEIKIGGMNGIFHWQANVDTNSTPYLKEHVINEVPLYPATAYIEAVLEAQKALLNTTNLNIGELHFNKAFSLTEKLNLLQLSLERNHADNSFKFKFFKQEDNKNEQNDWTLLSKGSLDLNSGGKSEANISEYVDLKQKHTEIVDQNTFYERLTSCDFNFGAYFQGVEKIWCTSEKVLAKISPTDKIKKSTQKFVIHPAYLDACFQSLFMFFPCIQNPEAEKASYIVVSIKNIQLHKPVSYNSPVWVGAKIKSIAIENNFETGRASLAVFDQNEEVILEVGEVCFKKIEPEMQQEKISEDWLYKVNWEKRSLDNNKTEKQKLIKELPVIIFSDDEGVASQIKEELLSEGQAVCDIQKLPEGEEKLQINDEQLTYSISLENKSHYNDIIQHILKKYRGISKIIYCWGIEKDQDLSQYSGDKLHVSQMNTSMSLIYLLQVLNNVDLEDKPEIAVVSNGIHSINNPTNINIEKSTLWGVSKVLANEIPEYNCKRFDLSFYPSKEETKNLCKELFVKDNSETEILIRNNQRYVSRLTTVEKNEIELKQLSFISDASYIITGFKGLAMVFIEWMFERGARNFMLTSRSGKAPEEIMERIKNLKEKGANIKIKQADVNNFDELKEVFEQVDDQMPKLKGVIHAAGLYEGRQLTEMSYENYDRITSPKVKGAWNLHLLTKSKELDWFIMFSSASALIGNIGLAHYVAGNTFMDMLAHYRQMINLPAMSVNWGAMKDAGMLTRDTNINNFTGGDEFELTKMKDAINVFEKISESNHKQIGIFRINIDKVTKYFSTLSQTNYLSELVNESNDSQTDSDGNSFLENLLLSKDSDSAKVKLIEELLIEKVARVINSSTSKINRTMTFKGLGIDSLMAVQLKNQINKDLATKVSVTTLWAYPTIKEYSKYLMDTINKIYSDSKDAENPMDVEDSTPLETEAVMETVDLNDKGINELSNELDKLL
jgi:acyl transferase domain-containing protein/acyl carrier protein